MLERFIDAKRESILRLAAQKDNEGLPAPLPIKRSSLRASLLAAGPGAVVAEYKRASPTQGVINPRMGAKEAAAAFAAGGAAGMSILTEKRYFQGTLAFLERARWANLPLLRKDFLFDPLQIEETAATPASAVLLIARYFVDDPDKLKSMALMAKQFKLETVVEIFSPVELELARESGPDIIQVNNRDLDSLEVDLSRSRDLADLKAEDEVWISASGISAPNQVQGLGAQGYDGVLVGTWLMRQANLEAALCYLRGTGDQLKNRGSQRWAY